MVIVLLSWSPHLEMDPLPIILPQDHPNQTMKIKSLAARARLIRAKLRATTDDVNLFRLKQIICQRSGGVLFFAPDCE